MPAVLLLSSLILMFAATGCGGGDDSPPLVRFTVEGPRLLADGYLPKRFRCEEDVENVWIPLRWRDAPREATEFAVVIGVSRFKDEGESRNFRLVGEWLIGGIPFDSHGIGLDELPAEAFMSEHHAKVGTLCPKGRRAVSLVATVYALPFGHELQYFESEGGVSTIEALNETAIGEGSVAFMYRRTPAAD